MTKDKDPVIPEVMPAEKRPVGRPPKVLDIVGDKSMPDRISAIKRFHDFAAQSAANAVVYAILCGLELCAAKGQVRHGKWEGWVENNCPFDRTTAWRYMTAAERKSKDPAFVARVQQIDLSQSPALMPDADRQRLLEAVKDATDGETVSQMYLNLGIVKSPVAKGGAREGAGRPTHNQAYYDSKVEQAFCDWELVAQGIGLQMQKGSYRLLERKTLVPLLAVLSNAATEIEAHMKSLK